MSMHSSCSSASAAQAPAILVAIFVVSAAVGACDTSFRHIECGTDEHCPAGSACVRNSCVAVDGGPADSGDVDADDTDVPEVDVPDIDAPEISPPDCELQACGGCVALTIDGASVLPGDPCGPCGGGIVYCNGADQVRCSRPTGTNACDSCGTLPVEPGVACGTCGDGATACAETGGVGCEGARNNGCGGCAPSGAPRAAASAH